MGPATRIRNWDVAVVDLARQVLGSGFAWGETDCASLVRRALGAMYEQPPVELPSWDDRRGAIRAYRQIEDVVSFLEREAGAAAVPDNFEWIGDVVVAPGGDPEGLPELGIVIDGRKVLTSEPDSGVFANPLSAYPDGTVVVRV